jgi:hypothetical protein
VITLTANSCLSATPGLLFRLVRVEDGTGQQDRAHADACARFGVEQGESAAEVPESWCERLGSAFAVLIGDAPKTIARRIGSLAMRP